LVAKLTSSGTPAADTVRGQYTGTAGRIENAQVAVFLAYASSKGRALIDRDVYLPKVWTDDNSYRVAPTSCPALCGFRVPEHCDSLLDPSLARFGFLRALDGSDMLALVAVSQAIIGGAGDRVGVQRAGEVRRGGHDPGLGIQFQFDLDLVAGHDSGGLPVGVTQTDQVAAAHDSDPALP
jgi:hypothetical protein